MKYARISNNMAVDVRDTHPHGFFTPDIEAQFVTVPDDVQDGYLYDGEVFTAPPAPIPPTQEDIDAAAAGQAAALSLAAQAAIRAQIASLEAAQLMPRATREFMLLMMQSMFTSEQLAGNPGYVAVKAFDDQINALRGQL